jgi:hypothetical protein
MISKEADMAQLLSASVLAACIVLAGCGATQTQLRTRAAFDLACAPGAIRTEAIDGATQLATGCGKRAIYVEMFNNSRNPTWLLNSSVESVSVPPAAQAMR